MFQSGRIVPNIVCDRMHAHGKADHPVKHRSLVLCRAFSGLFLVSVLCSMPGIAFAHAFPLTSDPKVGSTVFASPPVIRIWFDADLEPAFSTITVKDSQGRKVDSGDGRVSPSDATLLQVKMPVLAKGIYRVIWAVVSRDGHRTEGDYTFEIK